MPTTTTLCGADPYEDQQDAEKEGLALAAEIDDLDDDASGA
jgi:hypothetical protein